METLIARQKFCKITLDKDDLNDPNVETNIEKAKTLITKHSLIDLEVLLLEKNCPTCEHNLLAKIDISEKSNQPYFRMKCSNKDCDYIHWVKVAFKKDYLVDEAK